MESETLLSRAQLGKLAQVDDDALGFWLRSELLVNEADGPRKHRRYTIDEAKIAAILGEAREYGVNIVAMKKIASAIRAAQSAYSADPKAIDRLSEIEPDEIEDRAKYQAEWELACVGSDLCECMGTLLIWRESARYAMSTRISDSDDLPARSAMAFDLSKVLANFRERK